MKRACAFVLAAALCLSLTACGVKYTFEETGRFTQEEMRAAADTVRREFPRGWAGNRLKEIIYDEARTDRALEYSTWLDPENTIVMLIENGGWDCTLVRDSKGSEWRVISHGYC